MRIVLCRSQSDRHHREFLADVMGVELTPV
jgi:hypothetical protein